MQQKTKQLIQRKNGMSANDVNKAVITKQLKFTI